ncbi:hypothetical protein H7H82_13915 [Mycobacterium heidelbergense]|uniref:Uncharacterized protein n=1 Tax=Mycobacterium heidelbergense TaxID=53376 RepID=A0A1X0DGT2_MYCHE|nr:hypothetical protein [Mycobacterium heidelbergense]MCV7051677.1 hypothetical protein [Mycobacterium heidelbergense]ORA71402.1 hypothetical protein BST25_16880 [Mycobacterium heidelbergense]BBZ50339.1 hypothetical protein MHEI_20560 [Mycobacterium heidelbergense]
MRRSILVDDHPQLPTAAQYRERSQRTRVETRSRYRDHLARVLSDMDVDDAQVVAKIALDALTEWRDIETGELCSCSCHPQLPSNDLHDLGFACNCTRTRRQRRESFRGLLNAGDEYWQSPEGLQLRAADEAAEDELQAWLVQQQGVVVDSHGGWAPEQWRGTVDGHSFYFRERGGDWDLEIDLRPTGQSMRIVDGQNDDGTTRYRQHALERGSIVASGTIYADGYGTTPAERARFIVTTIRDHLRREVCTHHLDLLDAISTVLEAGVNWCPTCGVRLAGH